MIYKARKNNTKKLLKVTDTPQNVTLFIDVHSTLVTIST